MMPRRGMTTILSELEPPTRTSSSKRGSLATLPGEDDFTPIKTKRSRFAPRLTQRARNKTRGRQPDEGLFMKAGEKMAYFLPSHKSRFLDRRKVIHKEREGGTDSRQIFPVVNKLRIGEGA